MPSPLDEDCCGKPPTSKPATGSGMFDNNGSNSMAALTDEQKKKLKQARLRRLGRRR